MPILIKMASPFASHRARLIAFMIDFFVWYASKAAGSLMGIFLGVAASQGSPDLQPTELMLQGFKYGWVFWGFVAFFMNYGVLQGLTGATLGKHFAGIRVVTLEGGPITIMRSLLRATAYAVSAIPLGLGFFSILWSNRAQGFHDFLTSTVVIRKNVSYPVIRPLLETQETSSDEFKRAA